MTASRILWKVVLNCWISGPEFPKVVDTDCLCLDFQVLFERSLAKVTHLAGVVLRRLLTFLRLDPTMFPLFVDAAGFFSTGFCRTFFPAGRSAYSGGSGMRYFLLSAENLSSQH